MLRTCAAATAAICLIAGTVEVDAGRRPHHARSARLDPLLVPACSDERYCSIAPLAKSFGVAIPRKPRAMHHKPRKVAVAAVAPHDAPRPSAQTAVYDISAHTVYLPDGRRLEAHSGLGPNKDRPERAHLRMRGPTPPGTYTLAMREKKFHGVRAIRLIPVDEDRMFGRAGILAHSYMLGGNGDSNGCLSIRDYAAFLYAFLRGAVTRIVVVGRG